jgi:hypothetical protein
MNLKLSNVVRNVIKENLHEKWVSETYDWIPDFVYVYCSDWFYTTNDCFTIIENDAREYSEILYFVLYHDRSYNTTVDLFNDYIVLCATRLLHEDAEIRSICRNLLRIHNLRQILRPILKKVFLGDIVPIIQEYIGNSY